MQIKRPFSKKECSQMDELINQLKQLREDEQIIRNSSALHIHYKLIEIMDSKIKKLYYELESWTPPKKQNRNENLQFPTEHGVGVVLSELFGNIAHIIHPNLSLLGAPSDRQDSIGAINYVKKIEELVKSDKSESLSKPIISMWNNFSKYDQKQKIKRRAQWQGFVLIPINFKGLNGKSVKNENEILFLIDPKNGGISAPLLAYLLRNKISYSINSNKEGKQLLIGGIFPKLQYCYLKQTAQESLENKVNHGFSTIYHVIMYMLEGRMEYFLLLNNKNIQNQILSFFPNIYGQNAQTISPAILNDVSVREMLPFINEGIKSSLKKTIKQQISYQYQHIAEYPLYFSSMMVVLYYYFENFQRCISIVKNKMQPNFRSLSEAQSSSSSQFAQMVEKSVVFVDKSQLIAKIFQSEHKYLLFTRPRRWGKSMNLDMMKLFFEILVDDSGKRIHKKNKAFFEGGFMNGKQFKKFKVTNYPKVMQMAGQRPVIHFSLHEATNLTSEALLEQMKNIIKKCYQKHQYLLENLLKKSQNQQIPLKQRNRAKRQYQAFQKILKLDIDKQKNFYGSIKVLSQLLYKYFKRHVVILIDQSFSHCQDSPSSFIQYEDFYCKGQSIDLFANQIYFVLRLQHFFCINFFHSQTRLPSTHFQRE